MNRDKIDTIVRIAERGLTALQNAGVEPMNKLDLMMDVEYTNDVIPLDLQQFIDFDDDDFSHDIGGIYSNFNRVTKQMDNQFVPRCAVTQTNLDAQLALLQVQWEGKSELISQKGSLKVGNSLWRVTKLEDQRWVFRYFQVGGKVVVDKIDADTLIFWLLQGRDPE